MRKLKILNNFILEVENKLATKNTQHRLWLLDSIVNVTELIHLETDQYKDVGVNLPYVFKLIDYMPELGHGSGILIKLPTDSKTPNGVFSVAYYAHQCTLSHAKVIPASIIEWYNAHTSVAPVSFGYVNSDGYLV